MSPFIRFVCIGTAGDKDILQIIDEWGASGVDMCGANQAVE